MEKVRHLVSLLSSTYLTYLTHDKQSENQFSSTLNTITGINLFINFIYKAKWFISSNAFDKFNKQTSIVDPPDT